MSEPRPVASLSLDLDNQWCYMRTGGDPGWTDYPSCLDVVVPRMLGLLADQGLRMTVFVVGKDASLDRHADLLRAVHAAGHELGNHSFHHEAWLHLYTDAEIESELSRTEEAIEALTGRRPTGFRGPGYSLSAATLRALAQRGYRYDATTLPTFIGPLARAYYFRTTGLDREERKRLGALFGGFREGFRPNRPYRWKVGDGDLLEIPVTTMPGTRLPIHFSYVLALAARQVRLARRYFSLSMRACRWTGTAPSLLLHSLDFVDRSDVPGLAFFPGMDLPHQTKTALLSECLASLGAGFDVLTMGEHDQWLRDRPLDDVSPVFRQPAGRGTEPER